LVLAVDYGRYCPRSPALGVRTLTPLAVCSGDSRM
jgi:hypothetical protein